MNDTHNITLNLKSADLQKLATAIVFGACMGLCKFAFVILIGALIGKWLLHLFPTFSLLPQ